MEMFEQSGFGRLDPTTFGMWLNIDRAVEHPDKALIALMLSSISFPLNDAHREYIATRTNREDQLLAINLFTLFIHETRHFHDLLVSPYGAVLMREYVRTALYYLFLKRDLIYHHSAIFVPLSDWVSHGELFSRLFDDLSEPSDNIIGIANHFNNMNDRLSIYNRGRLNVDEVRYPTADSIVEASAILMQERFIHEEYGPGAVKAFRHNFSEVSSKKYYGVLAMLKEMAGEIAEEAVSLLLLVCLYGNFRDPRPDVYQYPTDVLMHIMVWFAENGVDLSKITSMDGFRSQIDDYFEETHGGDLYQMIAISSAANKQRRESLYSDLRRFEEIDGLESPEARCLLKVFDNYCEVHEKFARNVLTDPIWYCSPRYLKVQRQLPTPIILIESENGFATDSKWEKLYKSLLSSTIYLTDLPESAQGRIAPLFHGKEVVKGAHIFSPNFQSQVNSASWPMEDLSQSIDVNLWLENNGAVQGLRFLIDGPYGRLSKLLSRDMMSALTLVGTKAYGENGQIEPEYTDPNAFDSEMQEIMANLRLRKSKWHYRK